MLKSVNRVVRTSTSYTQRTVLKSINKTNFYPPPASIGGGGGGWTCKTRQDKLVIKVCMNWNIMFLPRYRDKTYISLYRINYKQLALSSILYFRAVYYSRQNTMRQVEALENQWQTSVWQNEIRKIRLFWSNYVISAKGLSTGYT